MDKRSLSERDICTRFVTPALRRAGWDEMRQIREEVSVTKGRIVVRGKTPRYYQVKAVNAAIEARGCNLDIGNPHVDGEEHGDPETLPAELNDAEAGAAAARDRLKEGLPEALLR